MISTEPAMMFDSVYVFTKGLEMALVEGPELQIRLVQGPKLQIRLVQGPELQIR